MSARSIIGIICSRIALPAMSVGQGNRPAKLTGAIQDHEGAFLPMVNVQIAGNFDDDATNERDWFAFHTVAAEASGDRW